MLRGLDGSSVQQALPFDKLAPEFSFVILKAQEGNKGFDPWFQRNMNGALEAGIEPFAYCFPYPLPHLDPKAQAKLFVDSVYRFREMRGRPIFLDFEWPSPDQWVKWGCTAPQIAAWCRVLCEEVERLTGVRPIVYTYPWWWATLDATADVEWVAQYPLWLAAYTNVWPGEGSSPKIPPPWATWLFWQFDGDGGLKLPNGVDADFCVFNGTIDDLKGLIRRDEAPLEIVHAIPEVE